MPEPCTKSFTLGVVFFFKYFLSELLLAHFLETGSGGASRSQKLVSKRTRHHFWDIMIVITKLRIFTEYCTQKLITLDIFLFHFFAKVGLDGLIYGFLTVPG